MNHEEHDYLAPANAADALSLPASAFAACVDCGGQVDTQHRLSLREVIGFARAREAGGQNHVMFRRETGRWMCANCAVRRSAAKRAGTMPEQESLL